jgi:hypothetical protein
MTSFSKLNAFSRLDAASFFEWTLFICLIFVGMYATLQVGVSWDEEVEFKTYLLNLEAVKGLIRGDLIPYQNLSAYHDRYYGVGFHWINHGLGGFLNFFNGHLLEFSQLGSRLLWAHLSNFLAFMVSGIVFRQCLLLLTNDRAISSLGALVYLLWPYLLGHSMMNVKDAPFMFVWLACTYQSLRILKLSSASPVLPNFLILGALTGWLTSIRVSGILILTQYLFFAPLFFDMLREQYSLHQSFKRMTISALGFTAAATLFLYILYPILWHKPLEFLNAIAYMGSHPWQGNTLTAGEFIEPKTRLVHYLFLWLTVKLPIIVLLGIIAAPYAYYLRNKTNKSFQCLVMLSVLLGVMTILGLLILKRVALYNELRQILFISPLLLLAAIISLHTISRKFAIAGLVFTAALMVVDNAKLFPYQYSYINEIARYTQVGNKYETDYFGLSVSEAAHWLNLSDIDGSAQCLYVPSTHLWEYELDAARFPCMAGYPGDLSLINKPFIFYAQLRGGMAFPVPQHCHEIHLESRGMALSNIRLKMGALYACAP